MNLLSIRAIALSLGTLALAGAATVCIAADKPAKGKMTRANPPDVIKDVSTTPAKSSPLDFTVKDINGKDVNLADYKGKVVMIVNVASKCGNTPQYKPMEAMYEKYKDKGFVILGFPANQFLSQEPGTNEEIKQFCQSTYDVKFPMMSKIVVKGEGIHPLYAYLTDKEKTGEFGGDISWNFAKFIVDRNGSIIARLNPKTQPDDPKVVAEIDKALAAKPAK